MNLAKTPIPRAADASSGDGQVLANLATVLELLRRSPPLAASFAYDDMLGAALLIAPLLGMRGPAGGLPRRVEDTDVALLQELLQRNGLAHVAKATVRQAIDLRARERAFHPVRDYLAALAFDGRPRLGRWLTTYLGAAPSPYAGAVGEMFMVAMVARIFEPGCKADHMLILEGPQGSGKSTACAILGGAWFSDNLPDVAMGREAAQHLAGKWLIEIAEMSALSRAEETALKAFISRPADRYRPSYGRREIIQNRQCVFVGTTNRSAYLRDASGGRRYWPVATGRIDTQALARDRDVLFAEAVLRYRQGRPWWPDAAGERTLIRPQQEARFETDDWEETIAAWLAGRTRATIGEIARAALLIETARLGTADQRRIAALLERLGWRRLPKDRFGNRPWGPAEGAAPLL